MKYLFVAFGCAALFCVTAAGQTGTLSKSDQEFIDMAAQTDMLEARLGQLVQDQASSQKVKDYAQMLVTDHTADYNQVSALATKVGGTVPKGLDKAGDRMVAPFTKAKGTAFDHRYVHDMVAGHTKAIAAYKHENEHTQNADIKAYINQTLPTLEKHLQGAQDLEKEKPSS